MRLRLLDLFCGSGGAGAGYARAGFDVVGVDIEPRPRYPFAFVQADALEYLAAHGRHFDAIHASPPCQLFSPANFAARKNGTAVHENMIPQTRALLLAIGKPYVIENVPAAPLNNPVMLCGTMFGLGVFRHRNFESDFPIVPPEHAAHRGKIGDGRYFSVAGGAGRWRTWGTVVRDVSKGSAEDWRRAMGISWMTRDQIAQAIPPAYTEFIGFQLRALFLSKPQPMRVAA